jgi:tRNA pseudouridine13 synthase
LGATRYTDFLVNEIVPDGRVLHLENLKVPRNKQGEQDGKAEISAGVESAQTVPELKEVIEAKEPIIKTEPDAKEEDKVEEVAQVS